MPYLFSQDKYGIDLKDNNGKRIKNPEYDKYIEIWGTPIKDRYGSDINTSAPKILARDKDGKIYLRSSLSGSGTFELGGKKYYENIY